MRHLGAALLGSNALLVLLSAAMEPGDDTIWVDAILRVLGAGGLLVGVLAGSHVLLVVAVAFSGAVGLSSALALLRRYLAQNVA